MIDTRIVHHLGIEENAKSDFAQLNSYGNNHHAGNYRWKEFAKAVEQPAYRDLASAGEDHHAAYHRKSKNRRGQHGRRQINCRNHGRAEVTRADWPQTQALQDGQKRHCDHRQTHGIARSFLRELCRLRHQRHHDQVRTDHRHMLKADCDQRYRWRFFISGIDQVFGSLSHFLRQ